MTTTKYTPEKMLPTLRLFVEARRAALALGFTDNGGAIHSIERILHILCVVVRYPGLSHINNLKKHPRAEISVAAALARDERRISSLRIEHVKPQRAFALKVAEMIEAGADDKKILTYIRRNFRLVVLTTEEARAVDRMNRSRMTADRIRDAKIRMPRLRLSWNTNDRH